MQNTNGETIESLISKWRVHLLRHEEIHSDDDFEELEARLREQIIALQGVDLADDEVFIIAVRRLGRADAASRGFARERFEWLWEQSGAESASFNEGGRPLALTIPGSAVRGRRWASHIEIVVVLGLAVTAALSIKIPEVFGYRIIEGDELYARNLSLFIFPMLTGYFAWKRGLDMPPTLWLVLAFVAAAFFANIFPFTEWAETELLTALHLPIALWLIVGFAYVGGRWRSVKRRIDFVRFSGELFIYYTLIALGGGVLSLLTWALFIAIDVDVEYFIVEWVLPCGAMGAVLVGAWLVERQQSFMQNIAPTLSRVFTPLFAAMLFVFLVAIILTGEWSDMAPDTLIGISCWFWYSDSSYSPCRHVTHRRSPASLTRYSHFCWRLPS